MINQTQSSPIRQTHPGREAFVAANAALLYTLPFLGKINWWGIHDWELFTAMAEIPRTLIIKFGQFPFWNPYIGGGNILFHHPEVAVFSPLYIFPLMFGAVVGLKLQILVCYFLGFWGTVRFARSLGASELAGYLVSSIYFGSVYFALHFAEGHIPFTHFCFLPWIGYFWVRSLKNRKFLVHASVSLALMILGNGAAMPALYTATFLGLLAGLFCIQRRGILPLANLALIGLIGVGLSAVKFVPMAVFLAANPWAGSAVDLTPLGALSSVFFSFDQGLFSHKDMGLQWGWHEYGAFLPPVALALALWYRLRGSRSGWIWAALVLFFLLLGLGGFADWSPWALLSNLPGFSSARSPGRAFQFVLLSFGIMAGFGFDNLRAWLAQKSLSPRALRWSVVVIFALTVGVNFWLTRQSLSQSFTRRPIKTQWSEEFTQSVGGKLDMYKAVRENRGVLAASRLSAYQENRGLLTPREENLPEYVLSGQAQTLARSYRGNSIAYTIIAETPGEIILGMGYDEGWKLESPSGWSVRDEQGLLCVSFSPGENSFELTYRPPYFWTGAMISILTLGFLIVARRHFK